MMLPYEKNQFSLKINTNQECLSEKLSDRHFIVKSVI